MKNRLFAVLASGFATPFLAGQAPQQPAVRHVCGVSWNSPESYDLGYYPSVSMNDDGYVVEGHQEQSGNNLHYRVGRLTQGGMSWGRNEHYDDGYYPAVALRNDRMLVEVHGDAGKTSLRPKLHYRVGRLVLDEHNHASEIHWFTGGVRYDAGYEPSVAINNVGTVVEVHEGNEWPDNHELYYRVGHLVSSGESFSIHWDSGSNGIEYTKGWLPHISIDDNNNVVEVHSARYDPDIQGARDSHYRRGIVRDGRIEFAEAASNGRYLTGTGSEAAAAITNQGFFLETHTVVDQGFNFFIRSVVGQLDPHNSSVINLEKPPFALSQPVTTGSSVTTNGRLALEVHTGSGFLSYSYGHVSCPTR